MVDLRFLHATSYNTVVFQCTFYACSGQLVIIMTPGDKAIETDVAITGHQIMTVLIKNKTTGEVDVSQRARSILRRG